MLQTLVTNLWPSQGEELVRKTEIPGIEGSSVNAFCLPDVLAGPSRVHIWTTMAVIMPAVGEQVKTLCSATDLIAVIKDAIPKSSKLPPIGA